MGRLDCMSFRDGCLALGVTEIGLGLGLIQAVGSLTGGGTDRGLGLWLMQDG